MPNEKQMPTLPADMIREIGGFLDDKSFKNWRQTCSFFARETFNDLVKREKNKFTVKQILADDRCTFFINENNRVWFDGHYPKIQGVENLNDMPTQIPELEQIFQVARGYAHTLFLKKNSTVWSCGRNSYGQLGLNNQAECVIPTRIQNLNEIQQISAGWGHSLFLKNDGTVWGCGNNSKGQLGLNDSNNRSLPTQISLTDVKQISVAWEYTLFLKNDGTVWGCGNNHFAQLGLNDRNDRCIPTQIPELTDVKAISAGSSHSVFLKKDGTVLICGDDAIAIHMTPSKIQSLTDIQQISAGGYHTLFLKKDGTVFTYGNNIRGQLGLGDNLNRNVPTKIPELTEIQQVSAGGLHSVFLQKNGTVMVCGQSAFYTFDPAKRSKPSPFFSQLNQIEALKHYHEEATYMKKNLSF